MGATHIRLAVAGEDVLRGALQVAWKLRVEKNAKTGSRASGQSKTTPKAKSKKKR
jgi:hypothetical protein